MEGHGNHEKYCAQIRSRFYPLLVNNLSFPKFFFVGSANFSNELELFVFNH